MSSTKLNRSLANSDKHRSRVRGPRASRAKSANAWSLASELVGVRAMLQPDEDPGRARELDDQLGESPRPGGFGRPADYVESQAPEEGQGVGVKAAHVGRPLLNGNGTEVLAENAPDRPGVFVQKSLSELCEVGFAVSQSAFIEQIQKIINFDRTNSFVIIIA